MYNRTGSLDLIKKINRNLVLDMIRSEKKISRALVAKKLGLSRSTVTSIVNELIKKKFVVETGLGDSTKEGGRRGIELGFNPKSGYGIGVDIGRTRTLIVLTDLDGEIEYKEECKTTATAEETLDLIQAFIQKSGIEKDRILGMGIGLPGIVDSREGLILDVPALNWGNINLVEKAKNDFPFPVYVNNDVNFAALGERWLGSEGMTDNMFFIAIGTGVGGAIIANGELIEGYRYSAGEINRFIDREDLARNRRNGPGEMGAFEQQISAFALERSGISPEELFARYTRAEPEAVRIIDGFVQYLSITIANIVSLLNPQRVIIGGGVSGSMSTVIEDIRKQVSDLTPIPTEIKLARLGRDAGGLGAVAYVFQQLQDAEDL